MNSQFLQSLQEWVPNYKELHFLLAVSGGRDSMVMAHLFHKNGLSFSIAHCNFHLRGEHSNHEMIMVQGWAAERNITCYVQEFDTYALLEKSPLSIEMLARELRYQWFDSFTQYPYICTAHHAQDNIETIFLNLARGTGYKGLNGINALRKPYLRPLLQVSSEQIEKYAQFENVTYCIDASNLENVYLRNKVRNQILPLMEELQPQFLEVMQKNIALFNQQYSLYQYFINDKKDELCVKNGEEWEINIASVTCHPCAEPLLYELLSPFGFNSAQITTILAHSHQESGALFYSNDYILLKDRKKWIITSNECKNESIPITIAQPTEFAEHGYHCEEVTGNNWRQFTYDHNTLLVDAEIFLFPITLRNWQEGDFFYPLGMAGKKKLSNFFTDQAFTIFDKRRVPILCVGEAIAWIVGHRADNRFKITNNTKKFYKITYHG